MRALLAGLFVFGGLLLGVAAIGARVPHIGSRTAGGPAAGRVELADRSVLRLSGQYLYALIVVTALGACTHVGRPRVLTTNDQLIASAVSWAVRVAPRALEYRVEIPAAYPRDAILAAAAADATLIRRGTTLRRSGETEVRELVRITVRVPERAAASAAPPEFRVPFSVTLGEAEPIDCVVRIRLKSDDPRSWIYAAEGKEHCWPRPGALTPP